MGGLYNMVFGERPGADAILAALGLSRAAVGRFRDAWVEPDGTGGFRVAVYTRNGGGNREHWGGERAEGPGCGCTGCTQAYALPKHPLHLFDRDDSFDPTYCTNYFRLPERYAAELKAIALGEPLDPSQQWADMIARLRGGG